MNNTGSAVTTPHTLTIRQAASMLGISRSLAYELVKNGNFPVPVLRLGRRMVVPRAALLRLLGSAVEEAFQFA